MATRNQVEKFYCQPLGQEKGKTYPISTATKGLFESQHHQVTDIHIILSVSLGIMSPS